MNSYHKTSAGTAADLVIKLKDFAVLHGWTAWQDADISNRWVIKSLTSQPVCLWASGDMFYMQGIDIGSPNTLAGYNAAMDTHGLSMPELHLMGYAELDKPDVIYFTMKFTNGEYRHGVVGEMAKIGAFTGGTIFYVSNHYAEDHYLAGEWPGRNSGSRCMFANNVKSGGVYISNGEGINWRPWSMGEQYGSYYTGWSDVTGKGLYAPNSYNWIYGTNYFSWVNTDSTYNWSTHLATLPFFIGRPNEMMSPIGYAPYMRVTYSPSIKAGDVVTVGGDSYRVWPIIRNNIPSGTNGSYDYYYCFYIAAGQETPLSV